MLGLLRPPVLVALVLIAAGCVRTPQVAVVTPPPVVVPPPAMPAGGHPGMAIPARLADGSYPTPNRALSAAGATWHLRAALNVAALACRGPNEELIIARYNAMLRAQGDGLRAAEAALADEYRAAGGSAWRTRYDDSMTRLYNFFSQNFARGAFCAEAATVLDQSESVSPDGFALFAAQRLPMLDRTFTDFYAAYDAWRAGQPLPRPVIALAATPETSVAVPRLSVDLVALQGSAVTVGRLSAP